MKVKFRLALEKYNPFLVLRNTEFFGVINVLYLDYLLNDGKVASIAVVYNSQGVLTDLNVSNDLKSLTGTELSDRDDLIEYVHVFRDRDDWVKRRVEPINLKMWLDMCSKYYSTVVDSIKRYKGAYIVEDAQLIEEPFNMVYVKAYKENSKHRIAIRAVNNMEVVYNISNIADSDKKDYMDLINYVNKCIGGEPVWKTL